ncbi:hypothetical protein AgCh_012045 [Apium graveolens]
MCALDPVVRAVLCALLGTYTDLLNSSLFISNVVVASAPFQSTLPPVPYYRYETLLFERNSLLAQIRELQHIIRTTDVDRGVRELREEIHVTRRVLEARLHGATLPGRGPDALMGWATEVMEDFERLAGPEFLWS